MAQLSRKHKSFCSCLLTQFPFVEREKNRKTAEVFISIIIGIAVLLKAIRSTEWRCWGLSKHYVDIGIIIKRLLGCNSACSLSMSKIIPHQSQLKLQYFLKPQK